MFPKQEQRQIQTLQMFCPVHLWFSVKHRVLLRQWSLKGDGLAPLQHRHLLPSCVYFPCCLFLALLPGLLLLFLNLSHPSHLSSHHFNWMFTFILHAISFFKYRVTCGKVIGCITDTKNVSTKLTNGKWNAVQQPTKLFRFLSCTGGKNLKQHWESPGMKICTHSA